MFSPKEVLIIGKTQTKTKTRSESTIEVPAKVSIAGKVDDRRGD